MIKENLIYPVLKEVDQGMINLHSEDFNITVHVFDEDIIKGISEIKKSIILKMMELSKNNEIIPLPNFKDIKNKEMIYLEINSDFIKANTERVNMTIPKNLLALIDEIGLNRSNYVSNLIWQDIFKKINK